jgi:hypothetical protein
MPAGWTALPNAMLEDGRLSLKARGLLAYLLSRPDAWETDSERLAASSHSQRDGRDSIRAGLKELVELRYMIRSRVQGERGRWATYVYVYPEPQNPEIPPVDNPVGNSVESAVDNSSPTTAFPEVGSSGAINNTKEQEISRLLNATTEEPVDNSSSALGRPSGLDEAALASSPSAAGASAPGVGYADDAASLALTDPERQALDAAQVIEPGIAMFALRAHLWRAGLYGATMRDALTIVQWHMRHPSYSKHEWRYHGAEALFRIAVKHGWQPGDGWAKIRVRSADTPPPAGSRE